MSYNNTTPTDHTAVELGDLRIRVRNIGGISEGEATLSPGVTLLSGENASNKSSFLRALSAVLGGNGPKLKSDADEGYIELETDHDDYDVTVTTKDGKSVVSDANRVSDRKQLCELFVSLDETNPVRRAIVNDDDLYDLLMRPIDTEEIESEIDRLQTRKNEIDSRLEEVDRMEDRLPTLQTEAESVQAKIRTVEDSLETKREVIEQRDGSGGTDEGQEILEELKQKRTERETIRDRIRTQKAALASLRDDLDEKSEKLAELQCTDETQDLDEIETEIEQFHHQKQQLTTTINALSPIVEMNGQLLDDETDIPDQMTSDDIISELDPTTRTITCWTCGNTVERSEIAEQVRVVKEILDEKRTQQRMITDRIESLKHRKQQLEEQREKRTRLTDSKQSIDKEITHREQQLEELEDDRASLQSEIEELQTKAEAIDEENDELVELHGEVSDLEYKRGQLENELADIETEIERIESARADRDDLEAERESISKQLQEQRDRIETIERDLVSAFNKSMQQVIDELAYENIERVWIERLTDTTGRSTSRTDFELHVVRSTADGAAYEDTIDTLSKSEREVIGLVVALAGYIAHDVSSELPIVVIDAVEMLDADRIYGLLTYFEQHADYVVAAVLPEEADELDARFPSILPTSSFDTVT
ncbi:archaea-specific SMC-related protein [Natrinema versiforme]|uniref:Chromosome segregation ATPase-like protein n=1 Tax=Natrinema versiforme JCM 10478 TaxID=1227496 RepID=L9XMD4_9EURY|nr:archaea-specific SMC-related protein [Natrinema versiforme]ELY62900.1 Chromosome segregation ATPase-like protein [Natrinema versiforme JCM 10478]